MNRPAIHMLRLVCGLVALAGCGRPTPSIPYSTPSVEHATPTLAPACALDEKDGFRDVAFGQSAKTITGFIATSPEGTSGRRTNEILTLNGVPLKEVNYHFYSDKLYRVELKFEIVHPRGETGFSRNDYGNIPGWSVTVFKDAYTNLSSYLQGLYGKPMTLETSMPSKLIQQRLSVWRGQKVRVECLEYATYLTAPSTWGSLTVESVPLTSYIEQEIARVKSREAKAAADGM